MKPDPCPERSRRPWRRAAMAAALLAVLAGAPGAWGEGTPSAPALLDGEHVAPAPIIDSIAPVAPANTRRLPLLGQWFVELVPDPEAAMRPVVGSKRDDAVAGQLRRLVAGGRAVGLSGVLYDNRDRGHSVLGPWLFPQLGRTEYDAAFRRQGLDYGVAGHVRFGLPVIGNSSTAYTKPPMDRSLARIALANQRNAMRAHDLYAANHIYVYPEHHDHDPERGDRLFAMAPHFLLSQGSSHSDRPFLRAFASILAALRPDTFERAKAHGLLAPLAQMILRRGLRGVTSAEHYLSPKAHRSAYDKGALRPEAMVTLANSIEAGEIPPLVRLRVAEDFSARPGQDFLATNAGERLFTTPTAIGRLWRSFEFTRRVVLDAGATRDPNGRALRFRWVVLKGDPRHIRITALDDSASRAAIEIDWHDPAGGASGGPRPTRVDIGVFADNGALLSAPSYFSVSLPLYQNRVYAGQGGRPRLVALNYRQDPDDPYSDPALWPRGDWSDRMESGADGALAALRRERGDGATDFLRWQGASLAGAQGPVAHQMRPDDKGILRLQQLH